ncbi:TetR/AcrR family transcriptional regulator [Pararhodospirillum photometricum]|uniref:Transcriptional regulator, TetR family n=1 Tax=Pararhodospirillum photometricum DSM 122 TaxID=1150469 RepID=H6SLH2_PARPM|nr:TetR/AcrR family transcriptional regulator [Pararhodospirillum photometricum]CCG08837.1 Transcriptional regulator, TetR family [Pararhodospirillum photometricum DSM 122]
MARSNTRQIILDAALECFLAQGFAGTSIADIRARSKASTGSIYHFFDGKESLALALCAEGLKSWAAAVCVVPANGTPEQIVRAMVTGMVCWALDNERLHRFMMQSEFLAPTAAQNSDLIDVMMEARLAQERILRGLNTSGETRVLPADLMRALILGPAEAYLRERAHGRAASLPEEAIETLGAAAWLAVRHPDPALAGLAPPRPLRAVRSRAFDLV